MLQGCILNYNLSTIVYFRLIKIILENMIHSIYDCDTSINMADASMMSEGVDFTHEIG